MFFFNFEVELIFCSRTVKNVMLKRDRTEFENIYVKHYSKMIRFAQEYVIRREDAENIVQDVFMCLWEQERLLIPQTNVFAFLFTSVKNRCVDLLRHKMTIQKTEDILKDEYLSTLQMNYHSLEAFDEKELSQPDIEILIKEAIDALPDKCREIFILNKIEGKKQKEIAQDLNISINTIESQMAIAYKKLKELLRDYNTLLVLFFI